MTTDTETYHELDSIIEMIAATKAKIMTDGKAAMTQAFKRFFETTPAIKSISWVQYTPYFNDGDPCYFSRHEICAKLDRELLSDDLKEYLGEEEDCYDYDTCEVQRLEEIEKRRSYGEYPEGLRTTLTDAEKDVVNNYEKLLKSIARSELDDLYLNVFGDHCKITASKSGIEIEEYEHD